MKSLRRLLEYLWESPTYGRDRATLLTAFTIGTAALLLNGVVLMGLFPFVYAPDDFVFQQLTDQLGFGQVIAMVLLCGACVLATLLIPLRLSLIFLEPRISRYFDQVVLSGISPLRYVIGKAAAQNLFLALLLFLLIPYLVLSLTLGGVNFSFFVISLFLIWLYCLSLALATLWLSLYFNELLSAAFVIGVASLICVMGCRPLEFPIFALSPFPAFMSLVYASVSTETEYPVMGFRQTALFCAVVMTSFIGISTSGIFLGPLFGLIRENSMFGEVVRDGDSKRSRWLRFRQHIQRSSELAFFYQNRGPWFRNQEWLIRWGSGFCAMVALSLVGYAATAEIFRRNIPALGSSYTWVSEQFHYAVVMVHALGLLLAVLLFSHPRNTTLLRLPLFRGIRAEVAWLDTVAFGLFLAISTAGSLATPRLVEEYIARPAKVSVYLHSNQYESFDDLDRYSYEATMIISVCAVVVYTMHRLFCLGMWMKSISLVAVGSLYLILVGALPFVISGSLAFALDSYRQPQHSEWIFHITSLTPQIALMLAVQREMGSPFPQNMTQIPFYVFHALLLLMLLGRYRIQTRKLRQLYLTTSAWNNSSD